MDRPFPIVTLSFGTLLMLVLASDMAFVFTDLAAFTAEKSGWIAEVPPFLKITRDWALPELVGYLKWVVIIAALLKLSVRDRSSAPFRWALVFLLILIDDSVQIHENLGLVLWGIVPYPPSLAARGEDLSELIVFAGMGLFAVAMTATLFFRHGPVARALSLRLLMVVAGLVVFGVMLDFVHQLVSSYSKGTIVAGYLPPFFSLLEDGGEMIVASFATAYVLTLPGLDHSPQGLPA